MGPFILEPEALECLRSAARLLVGAGPVKQRLCEATLKHLRNLDPAELPRDLAAPYRELMSTLCAVQATGGMGPVEATVRKMSDQDAAACAARILELYVALSGRDAREPAASAPRQLRLVGDD